VAVSVASLAVCGVGSIAAASPLAGLDATPITITGIDTASSAPL